MYCRYDFVAVRDESHLLLRETVHKFIARVVLRHYNVGELGSVIRVLQRLAIQVFISLLHCVRIDDKGREQGQVRLLCADFLRNDGILLVAVFVLLHKLPPVGDGLSVREQVGIIIPVGQGGIERHAVGHQVLVDNMLADIGREVQLNILERHKLDEDIARNVLALQHVRVDVLALGLGADLVDRFGLVKVKCNRFQAVICVLLIEKVADLLNTGGDAINGDVAALGLRQLKQLLFAHVVPSNLVRELGLEGARVLETAVRAGIRRGVRTGIRRLVAAGVRRAAIIAAAACRERKDHCKCQQKG